MGVQLSLALAVWAGVTELIPILGPWLGAIPALLIVAGTEPDLLIPVALLYLIVQQLENNLLVPRIQGHAVDIHPAMVILLLVVGGAAFGFIGLVIIVPLAAILRELFWYVDRRLAGATPDQAMRRTNVGKEPGGEPLVEPEADIDRESIPGMSQDGPEDDAELLVHRAGEHDQAPDRERAASGHD
jgi:hypothetical protein